MTAHRDRAFVIIVQRDDGTTGVTVSYDAKDAAAAAREAEALSGARVAWVVEAHGDVIVHHPNTFPSAASSTSSH
ncbi:hypothetical protein [Belnapia sp. F-4-1]|uniref:hypothetical protein n=1 Tax=Belnapia sp. F-4-1 TaxID=1545443 RepID=UPI0005BA67B4|nr:hypothetical protein [Belnapia sp. F-4-1]